MTGLMAHCDTTRVSEHEVISVQAPEFTKTWHPVAHGAVIVSLEDACRHHGLEIRDRQYSLNKTGSRMFGVWALDVGNGEIGYSLGFRNSTDKSMKIGVVAGTNVFVCDNMCFSGDFIAYRMHTSGLDHDELVKLGQDAVGGAVIEMEKLHGWQKNLHEVYVPKRDRKALVFDMIDRGVFSGGQFENYHKCLEEELAIRRGRPLDNTHSLFNLHGAATRLMRPWNLLRSSEATAKLNGICDDYLARRAA